MSGVFYHSVIHDSRFFICFMIRRNAAKKNKTRFFYTLYSDKTWVLDQSECAQGTIYIIMINKYIILLISWLPEHVPSFASERHLFGP